MRSYISNSETDTAALAATLAGLCGPGSIILLQGALGAGKTLFSQAFAAALGIREPVTSPTFPIIQEYDGRLHLYHMDLYRLSNEDDFIDIGADELLYSDGICLIEWPDRATDLYPENSIEITIDISGEGRREIRVQASESIEGDLPDEL